VDDFMAKLAAALEEVPSLEQLSLEVSRIAAQLALLAEREALARAHGAVGGGEPIIDARFVRALIGDRARRSLWFAPDFRHPGWSIMLELFARRLEGRPIRQGDLAPATGVSPSTMLRWVEVLAAQDLLVRRKAEDHARGVLVELSEDGTRRMHGYLSAALPKGPEFRGDPAA
jgi:hypothetical protein